MSEAAFNAQGLPSDADANPAGGFLTGLLFGALAGITVAMVIAPPAGDETAETLRARARDAARGVREAAEDASASADDLLARGKVIVDEARARLDLAVARGREAAAQQRSLLEDQM